MKSLIYLINYEDCMRPNVDFWRSTDPQHTIVDNMVLSTVSELIVGDGKMTNREKFGIGEAAIPATRVFKKEVKDFPDQQTKQECWILINDNDKLVTYVTTYNGMAGKKFDAGKSTFALDEDKKFKKKLNSHEQVEISECPVAISIGAEVEAEKVA